MKYEGRIPGPLLPSAFLPLALHRLVSIHGVQAGRVETRQTQVAHDDDLERVLGVLEGRVHQLVLIVDGGNHDAIGVMFVSLFFCSPCSVSTMNSNLCVALARSKSTSMICAFASSAVKGFSKIETMYCPSLAS